MVSLCGHDFKRDTTSTTCYACFDTWPSNETSVCKYYYCSICGVTVHAGCRSLALRSYPCNVSQRINEKNNDSHNQGLRYPVSATDWKVLHEKVCDGKIRIELIHAYDLDVASGESLYGVFKLSEVPTSTPTYSSCNNTVRKSYVATMGDNDCAWKLDPDSADLDVSNRRDSLALSDTPMSHSVDIPFTAWPNLRTHELQNELGTVHEIQLGYLQVEIWRSGYISVLDTAVGSCKINLLPLLVHHNVSVERWFCLEESGMILLRLLFEPKVSSSGETINAAKNFKFTSRCERKESGTSKDSLLQIDSTRDTDDKENEICNVPVGLDTEEQMIPKPLVSKDHDHDAGSDENKNMTKDPECGVINSIEHIGEVGDTDAPINSTDDLNRKDCVLIEGESLEIEGSSGKHIDHNFERPLATVTSYHKKNDEKVIAENVIPTPNESSSSSSALYHKSGSILEVQSEEAASTSIISFELEEKHVESNPIKTTASLQSSEDTEKPSSISRAISSWAFNFVYSSSDSRKKKSMTSGQLEKDDVKTRHADATRRVSSSIGDDTREKEIEERWRDIGNGIGTVFIHLVGLHAEFSWPRKCYVVANLLVDPKNSNSLCTPHPTTLTSSSALRPPLGPGDVDVESPFLYSLLDVEEETHIVDTASTLEFNSQFKFRIPHFHCAVQFVLVDALNERKIGKTSPVSVFSLLQRQADRVCYTSGQDLNTENGSSTAAQIGDEDGSEMLQKKRLFGTLSFSSSDPIPSHIKSDLDEQDDLKSSNSLEVDKEERFMDRLSKWAHAPGSCDALKFFSVRDESVVIGQCRVCLCFKENYQELFLDSHPQLALQPPEEAMSLDRVSEHFSRVGEVLNAFGWLGERYNRLMSWDQPLHTFTIMCIFIYSCLHVHAEYALCAPVFLVFALLTESWANRHFGSYRLRLVTPTANPLDAYTYRPVSYLRVAVSGFRNFGRKGCPKKPPPYMSISFLPEGPLGDVQVVSLENASSSAPKSRWVKATSRPQQDVSRSELHIASFFIPRSLLGAHNVFVPRRREVQKRTSGGTISSIITTLNFAEKEKLLGDAIVHNVAIPWRRSGRIAEMITEAFMRKCPHGMDSSVRSRSSSSVSSHSSGDGAVAEQEIDERITKYLDEADVSFAYPILQKPRPIGLSCSNDNVSFSESPREKRCTTKPSLQKSISMQFEPWTQTDAVVKLTLAGSSSGAEGQTMDNTWGYIHVPVKDIAREIEKRKRSINNRVSQSLDSFCSNIGIQDPDGMGVLNKWDEHEICMWCDVQWAASFARTFDTSSYSESAGDLGNPYAFASSVEHNDLNEEELEADDGDETDENMENFSTSHKSPPRPQVLLRVSLESLPPSTVTPKGSQAATQDNANVRSRDVPGVSQRDVDMSRIIQSIVTPKIEKKSSTISTLWNARDHIKFVQNKLALIVGTLESIKNIFNWTQPVKTLPLYLLVFAVWILTMLIPGRYLILILGLSEFLYVFTPQPEVLPFKTRVYNLLSSIPNDDDLKTIYASEKSSRISSHEKNLRIQRQELKLNMMQKCLWHGLAWIRRANAGTDVMRTPRHSFPVNGSVSQKAKSNWEEVFLAVLGHRLVWWGQEEDVDLGLGPLGEILLHGHTGTTQASPVDIKDLGCDDQLIAVFGRDTFGLPLKRTFLCVTSTACQEIKTIINGLLEGQH